MLVKKEVTYVFVKKVAYIGNGRKGGAEKILDKSDAFSACNRSTFGRGAHLHLLLAQKLIVDILSEVAVVNGE